MSKYIENIIDALDKFDDTPHGQTGKILDQMMKDAKAALEDVGIPRALNEQEIRAGINILLETIAKRFDELRTLDLWRSDAAAMVREFKHTKPEVTA